MILIVNQVTNYSKVKVPTENALFGASAYNYLEKHVMSLYFHFDWFIVLQATTKR